MAHVQFPKQAGSLRSGQPSAGADSGITGVAGTAGILPASSSSPAGWHSRGYLPHFDAASIIQSVTFRLGDSVPQAQIDAWKRELKWQEGLSADSEQAVALRKLMEKYEDAGHGACYLKDSRIAQLVQDALLHFDGQRYRMISWCIMPNHVHALLETGSEEGEGKRAGRPVAARMTGGAGRMPAVPGMAGGAGRMPAVPGEAPAFHTLASILHSWKSFTATQANRILGRSGEFWMPEYHDRYIRNEAHFHDVVEYIHENPVKAGLVSCADQWQWSSAKGSGQDARGPGNDWRSGQDARGPGNGWRSGQDARGPGRGE